MITLLIESFNLRFYLDRFTWVTLFDIAIVALVIYVALSQIRGTRAEQVLRGITFFGIVLLFINLVPEFYAVRKLVNMALPALLIAIPVIFQSELRRFFAQIGEASGGMLRHFRKDNHDDTMIMVNAIVEACRRMSTRRHGGLIVIEQLTGLQEYIDSGVQLNAKISSALLLSVFHKDAQLHDGAVIVRHDQLIAASCVMPLSSTRMSEDIGTRHRAALGISEVSDAVVVVVSEETGQITIAHDGKMSPRQPLPQLQTILNTFLGNNDNLEKVDG